MENPTLLEKLDLGNKFYRRSRTASAATSCARSVFAFLAVILLAVRKRGQQLEA